MGLRDWVSEKAGDAPLVYARTQEASMGLRDWVSEKAFASWEGEQEVAGLQWGSETGSRRRTERNTLVC